MQVETMMERNVMQALETAYRDFQYWNEALDLAETPEAVDCAIAGMNLARAQIRQCWRALGVA